MKKGITFYFGFNNNIEQRLQMIKEAGFEYIITNADKKFDYQSGNIASQVKLMKKYGLKHSSLHMAYNASDLHYFWEEGKIGEKLCKNLIKDVRYAYKYKFTCVVVHLFGEYSIIGEKRLKKVLKVCEKLNVPLAIENINCQKLFLECFKNIKSDYLKVCYDSGHNKVFDKDYDYFKNFGDKIICVHLSDNDGTDDWHTVTDFSSGVDWEMVAKGLKNKDIVLDYEVFNLTNENISCEEYLKKVIKMAENLEKLIAKYEKN